MTFRRVAVSLLGPGQSPVLPFVCCVESLRSDGRCGLCCCWCQFRASAASSWCTGVALVVAGVVLRSFLPTPLRILVVHHVLRCVCVCVRPNCSNPPRVVQVVRHLHPRAAMCSCPMYSISERGARSITRTFMVSAGVVRTSAGGACSFVVDAVSCALQWWHGWLRCARPPFARMCRHIQTPHPHPNSALHTLLLLTKGPHEGLRTTEPTKNKANRRAHKMSQLSNLTDPSPKTWPTWPPNITGLRGKVGKRGRLTLPV